MTVKERWMKCVGTGARRYHKDLDVYVTEIHDKLVSQVRDEKNMKTIDDILNDLRP